MHKISFAFYSVPQCQNSGTTSTGMEQSHGTFYRRAEGERVKCTSRVIRRTPTKVVSRALHLVGKRDNWAGLKSLTVRSIVLYNAPSGFSR